jgi:hypothetical protein
MFDTPDDPTTTLRPLYEAKCLFELYETPRSRSLEEVWQGKGGKTDMIFSTSFARSASVSPLSRASLIRESNQSVHWTVTSSSSDRRPKDYSDGVMNVSFRSMTSREELGGLLFVVRHKSTRRHTPNIPARNFYNDSRRPSSSLLTMAANMAICKSRESIYDVTEVNINL